MLWSCAASSTKTEAFDSVPGNYCRFSSTSSADGYQHRRAWISAFEMYRSCKAAAQNSTQTEALFMDLLRLSDSMKPPAKETLLITIGTFGRCAKF